MVPTVAITSGAGKTAVRVVVGGQGITTATAREQAEAVKPPRFAPGLAGRWRWTCTDWTAGQTTITGRRKAGPLRFGVQGVVKQTRSGFSQAGWVWSVERKSDRKGTPPGSNKGRASSYGDAVRASYVAAIALEGEVCGLRTVARNTRAGRTFESAARTTGRASKSQKQVSSVELGEKRTPNVRNKAKSRAGKKPGATVTGQKQTGLFSS